MKRTIHTLATLLAALLLTTSAFAQENARPSSSEGVNVFETVGQADGVFDGVKIYWGGDFTQQFQMLDHENDGSVELLDIGPGFNLATANLDLTTELADGLAVHLTTYLSSQHHAEAWVKGGYLQVDNLPIEGLEKLFEVVSLRVGHMEINYGDAHFRRTDNGQAIYNPFVGNMIMDSFATEIGGEVYVRSGDVLGMVGLTGGEIKGRVDRPDDRGPSIYGKVAYDTQLSEDLRLRLSGSVYTTSKSISNTLYSGDRAGTRFYDVLVEGAGDSFRNGRFNPGFRNQITAIQINPFVKFKGLEVHGLWEQAEGNAAEDAPEGSYTQTALDVIYRYNDLYAGVRTNRVSGEDLEIDRIQVAGGWFVTPNVLAKINYVKQEYTGFGGILAGGQFDGITIEGVVSF